MTKIPNSKPLGDAFIDTDIVAKRRKKRKEYILGFANIMGYTEKKFSGGLFTNPLQLQDTSLLSFGH